MREHLEERYSGRVTALLGSGIIVAIADPFVEVLVRFENLGPDRYEISDDELSYVGMRSRERITLGDTVNVQVIDVSIGRRTVYAERVAEPRTSKRPAKSGPPKGRPSPAPRAPKAERARASKKGHPGGRSKAEARPAKPKRQKRR
jgi:ribonuclease R